MRLAGRAWIGAVVIAVVAAGCTPSIDPTADPLADPFAKPIVPGTSPVRPSSTGSGEPGSGQTGSQSGADTAAWVAPTPRSGRGAVSVVLPQGALLPEEVAKDFLRQTGFSLSQVDIADATLAQGFPGADVIVGLDSWQAISATQDGVLASGAPEDARAPAGTALSEAPAAIAYARDDVCVMADTQWFAANRLVLPASMNDVASEANAALLVVPDPATSAEGRAFIQAGSLDKGDAALPWWMDLINRGAEIQSAETAEAMWTASSQGIGTRPLLVARQVSAVSTVNNTGTETASAPVPGTCVQRDLYAALTASPGNHDGAEAFIAYLLGPTVQHTLADLGQAYPGDVAAAQGTAMDEFAAPRLDATQIPASEVVKTPDWISVWSQALSMR